MHRFRQSTLSILRGLLAVWCIYFTLLAGSFGQNSRMQPLSLSPDKFNTLDGSAAIAKTTDFDRLAKPLLLQPSPPESEPDEVLGTRTMIMTARALASMPEAAPAICADLRNGDERLFRRLQSALVSLNVPSPTARVMVEKWAADGPDEALMNLLANVESYPEVADSFQRYLVEASSDWVKLTRGVASLIDGESEDGRMALANAIANATGENIRTVMEGISVSSQGDFPRRWNLVADSEKILSSRGALAREILRQQNIEGSLYDLGWKCFAEVVSGSPQWTTSYVERSSNYLPLYTAYTDILRETMRGSSLDSILSAILRGAELPQSRFRWMAEELSNQSYNNMLTEMKQERRARALKGSMIETLASVVKQEPLWAGVLLWHLTRPAEATALSVRQALTEAIAADPDVARRYLASNTPLGPFIDNRIQVHGGYSFYPGGRREFVSKNESGEINREALLQLSRAIAEVLTYYDRAWDILVEQGSTPGWLQDLTILSVERVPSVAPVWAQTMIKNDLALGDDFVSWLQSTQSLGEDSGNAEAWVQSIASQSSAAAALGNAEMARFKKLLQEYMSTTKGWKHAYTRLNLEGLGFPSILRSTLASSIISQPEYFWRLFRILTAAEGAPVSRLRPHLEFVVVTSPLPSMVLDEAAAENAFASDAAAPIWEQLLSENSESLRLFAAELVDRRVKTEPHALANLCFIEELSTPEGWAAASGLVPPTIEKLKSEGVKLSGESDRDQIIFALTNHAQECSWFYEKVLENPDFRSRWGSRIKTKVMFMGRAPAFAWLIKQNGSLVEAWNREMSTQIAKDPYVLRAFIDSLVTRRIGDKDWMTQVNELRQQIAMTIFSDRILVEQMLGVPEQEYLSALLGEVREIFGEFAAQEWRAAKN